MTTGPRNRIEAPPAASPRFGLIASLGVTRDVGRWESGIAYVPEGCSEGERFGDLCDVDAHTVADSAVPEAVEWDPYVLSVSETCSTFSGSADWIPARAERLLNMDTERQLGEELWDGALAQATSGSPNTWLADDSAPNFVTLGFEAEYAHALACLEQYLADHNGGQQGVIHATVQTVAHWESFRLLRREGNNILTFKDTIVIPSPGYSGNSPDGTTSEGNIWAYATDMPRILLGDVQVFTSPLSITDRLNNTVKVTAQRMALVEWQRCRHAGIQLDMTPCGAYY